MRSLNVQLCIFNKHIFGCCLYCLPG